MPHQVRQDSEQFIPHGSFLEPWAFVAQGVTGAAIERPFEGVLEDVLDASRKGDPGSSPG